MRKQVGAWQQSELTCVTAKVVIYEAFSYSCESLKPPVELTGGFFAYGNSALYRCENSSTLFPFLPDPALSQNFGGRLAASHMFGCKGVSALKSVLCGCRGSWFF